MRAVCAHIAVAALASLPAVTLASTNDEALAIALASSGEPVEQTLSPDQAFLPTVKQIGRDVELKFAVAAGYPKRCPWIARARATNELVSNRATPAHAGQPAPR
ncbi:hypothetical protein [Cupriavidus metallidurans]|nr:hypothetical protein [Cupriavidus metallidurans]QGS31185.1 hypothetical protein FOB83_19865 [Cupriavidus metallidurans]